MVEYWVQRYCEIRDRTIAFLWHFAYQTMGNALYSVTFTPKVKVREAG